MEQSNQGKLIDFATALRPAHASMQPISAGKLGTALMLEPRTIRHQERVEDLFYILFKRTGT